jgi:hypothetical protein
MDERGSNAQAGRSLPRDNGHIRGALGTRATVIFTGVRRLAQRWYRIESTTKTKYDSML